MPNLVIHLGSRLLRVPLPLRSGVFGHGSLRAAVDEASFKEEQHPRGKGGKFAKKNEVSNSVAVLLKEHGFKMKPDAQQNAHYEHPEHEGHKVSIGAVPEGFKYSSKWTHTSAGTEHGSGEGGKSLLGHLSKFFGPAVAKPAAATGAAGEATGETTQSLNLRRLRLLRSLPIRTRSMLSKFSSLATCL